MYYYKNIGLKMYILLNRDITNESNSLNDTFASHVIIM